jgi:hypothetical protein
MLYFKIKRLIRNKISFDRTIKKYHVHYNYYEDSIEIKNEKYEILEQIPLKLFKFRPSSMAKRLLAEV